MPNDNKYQSINLSLKPKQYLHLVMFREKEYKNQYIDFFFNRLNKSRITRQLKLLIERKKRIHEKKIKKNKKSIIVSEAVDDFFSKTFFNTIYVDTHGNGKKITLAYRKKPKKIIDRLKGNHEKFINATTFATMLVSLMNKNTEDHSAEIVTLNLLSCYAAGRKGKWFNYKRINPEKSFAFQLCKEMNALGRKTQVIGRCGVVSITNRGSKLVKLNNNKAQHKQPRSKYLFKMNQSGEIEIYRNLANNNWEQVKSKKILCKKTSQLSC